MEVETILPSGTIPSMLLPSKKQYASHISPHWSLGGFEEIVAQTSHQSPETNLTVSMSLREKQCQFIIPEGKSERLKTWTVTMTSKRQGGMHKLCKTRKINDLCVNGDIAPEKH